MERKEEMSADGGNRERKTRRGEKGWKGKERRQEDRWREERKKNEERWEGVEGKGKRRRRINGAGERKEGVGNNNRDNNNREVNGDKEIIGFQA
jgi:hypothetical protein